jgi:hypothetical protein
MVFFAMVYALELQVGRVLTMSIRPA